MNKLQCQEAELLLLEYLDGYLLPLQREALEEHLRGCSSCRDLLEGIRGLDAEVEGIPEVEEPEGLRGSILASLPRGIHLAPSPFARAARYSTLLAAMVLIVAAFLLGGRFTPMGPPRVREIEIVFVAPEASTVSLVGEFNAWNPARHTMTRRGKDGTWRATLRLPPGAYEYGFIIDGQRWTPDPQAEGYVADGFGGRNSVLYVEG